jgi:hypothetical protein
MPVPVSREPSAELAAKAWYLEAAWIAAERPEAGVTGRRVENFAVVLGITEGQPAEPQTMKGTKFEILFPALLPLVGPGAITPTKNVPGVVRNDAGMLACTSVALKTFDTKLVLALLELFQVTLEPATNPEPFTVRRMSWFTGALAPLGVIEVIEELTVGVAPR